MITKYNYKNLVWLDLESPTKEDAMEIMKTYGIHQEVAEELLAPSMKPKVDLYKNFIYLILHFPVIRRGNPDQNRNQEVDFVIGRDFIITTRYGVIDPLHKFSKIMETNSVLDKSEFGGHAGFLFFYMMRGMYDSLIRELDALKENIRQVEDRIFKGEEREMVNKISEISRDILDFKSATSMHKEVLASFEAAGRKFFGLDFEYHLRAILEEYYKVENALQSAAELVSELRATNDSLLNAKQTEVMKVMTIVAFIFLPFSIITGFFQMNTVNTPLIGHPFDWHIAVGAEFFVALILFMMAKRKKWL